MVAKARVLVSRLFHPPKKTLEFPRNSPIPRIYVSFLGRTRGKTISPAPGKSQRRSGTIVRVGECGLGLLARIHSRSPVVSKDTLYLSLGLDPAPLVPSGVPSAHWLAEGAGQGGQTPEPEPNRPDGLPDRFHCVQVSGSGLGSGPGSGAGSGSGPPSWDIFDSISGYTSG